MQRAASGRRSSTGAAFVWPDELEELVYVFVRIELVKRRRQRAAACLRYSPRACAAHAAVVRHACAPVALAGPCAAVATPSCDACVVGCDESGASGFEDIRPVRETAIPVAAYARRIGASRRDVSRHDVANGFANVGFASSAAELVEYSQRTRNCRGAGGAEKGV